MKKLLKLLALLPMLCWSMGAYAVTDLGKIELGKVYDIDALVDVEGTITAPSTGTLIQDGCPDIYLQDLDFVFMGYAGQYGSMRSYQVVEGQTYQVVGSFVMNAGQVVWNMESSLDVKLQRVLPQAGSSISANVNYTGQVIIDFNTRVQAADAKFIVGDKSVDLTIEGNGTNSLAVNIKPAFEMCVADGTLSSKGGEDIEIRLTAVQTPDGTVYNNDGVLSLKYKAAAKAVDLVSTNCYNNFPLKSYYPVGDPDAVLSFTFDAEVRNDGQTVMILSCGNVEGEGTFYYEEITPVIDGATITVDLAGKLRDLNSYLAVSDMPYVAAKLANVRDLSGAPAAGDGDTSIGSYNYSMTYDYIEPVSISSEFVPAAGASLEGVDRIEIWFNNANMVTFDGVLFSAGSTSVVVPKSELTITPDGNDLMILVSVPEQIKGQKAVTVTLNNLVSLDGYDHSKQISALYDAWLVTLVSPIVDGGSYAKTGEDDFVFTVNQPYGYMRYDFYNTEWVYGSWLTEQEDGTYTSYNGDYTLYENTDNYMLVRAWNEEADYWNGVPAVAEFTFHFTGLTEGFSYSQVKFVSIDPSPETPIIPTEDFCFTITFDGLVSISPMSCVNQGMGMTSEFAKIEAVDPEELSRLSNTWKLYPASYDLAGGSITISVFAYDELGKLVEGNIGGGEYDFLSFSYMITSDATKRSVQVFPADGSEVLELFSFEFSYPGMAVGINYNYDGPMPFISNKLGDTVYTFDMATDIEVYSEITGYDEEDQPIHSEESKVYMYMQMPVTEDGSYMLFVPEGFFIVGSQFETYSSNEIFAMYTIGQGASSFLMVEPGQGENVPMLDYIIINTNAQINPDSEDYIQLYSWNTYSSVCDWNAWSTYNNTLETITEDDVIIGYKLLIPEGTIIEDGEYTIMIPDGMFILDGVPNGYEGITFSVGEGGGNVNTPTVELTLDPAPGVVSSIEKIKIDAPGIEDAFVSGDEPITITDANGKVVATTTSFDLAMTYFDWDTWTFLGYYIDLGDEPITTPGVYVVDIPANMFEFLDMSRSMALTGVYTVSTTGISTIFVETADVYEVYNLAGVKVLSTDNAADLGQLRTGIYIVNGKKVMIK